MAWIDVNPVTIGDSTKKSQFDAVFGNTVFLHDFLYSGGANLKIFSNDAGDAPEWASGIYVGRFFYDTANASGLLTIDAVGFRPSAFLFLSVVADTSQVSIGFDDGNVSDSVLDYNAVAANTWSNSMSIGLHQAVNILTWAYIFDFNDDGCRLQFTKVGAKVGMATIIFIAFR